MMTQTFVWPFFQTDMMYEVIREIDELMPEFNDLAQKLNEKAGLTLESLISYLNREQVIVFTFARLT